MSQQPIKPFEELLQSIFNDWTDELRDDNETEWYVNDDYECDYEFFMNNLHQLTGLKDDIDVDYFWDVDDEE